jgi:hypothetical protein
MWCREFCSGCNFHPSKPPNTRCKACYCVCISRESSATRISRSLKNSTDCSPGHACHRIARIRSLAESYNNIDRNTRCTSHLDNSPIGAFFAAA